MNKYTYTILLLAITVSSCQQAGSGGNMEASAPTYEEAKLTVEQQEQQSPVDFLKVDATYRQNLIGEWVIEGNIHSNATVAKYKDPVLTIEYHSETQTTLGNEQIAIYKFITPGETLPFKIKRNGFQGTNSIGVAVSNATAVE